MPQKNTDFFPPPVRFLWILWHKNRPYGRGMAPVQNASRELFYVGSDACDAVSVLTVCVYTCPYLCVGAGDVVACG